jgi:hypothetical protein
MNPPNELHIIIPPTHLVDAVVVLPPGRRAGGEVGGSMARREGLLDQRIALHGRERLAVVQMEADMAHERPAVYECQLLVK